MGLDNMPMVYPCEGIAIKDSDGRTDCVATQACGNCGWKNEFESDPLTKNLKPVTGMFGADCWYRGKYGNYLLNVFSDSEDTVQSFIKDMKKEIDEFIKEQGDSDGNE